MICGQERQKEWRVHYQTRSFIRKKTIFTEKRGETKIILDFIVYLGSSLFVEEEYLFRLGLSFLIDKLSNILRSKSNWEESKITKSSVEKELFVTSKYIWLKDLVGWQD